MEHLPKNCLFFYLKFKFNQGAMCYPAGQSKCGMRLPGSFSGLSSQGAVTLPAQCGCSVTLILQGGRLRLGDAADL